MKRKTRHLAPYTIPTPTIGTAGSGLTDHGELSGLADDDHTHYLKERASGGVGTEIPVHDHATDEGGQLDWDIVWADAVHSHQTNAEGAKVDHGAALLGLLDDDHTQYFLLAGETTDAKLYSGADLLLYSDAGSTLKAALYGNSGQGVFVSVRTPLIDTASGNMTLQPAGDLIIDPTGNDALPALGYEINLGSLQKKYLTLHAAELWVETLVAHNTIATIGGRILVGPTTELIADVSTVQTTIDVKHNEMASGDRVYLEANTKVEFMAVTSGPTGITGGYRYNVTRNLDGSGANEWYAGDAVFNTGTTGDGFIDIYSYRSVKSATQFGPAIVGNVRNSATYNDWTERWAIGNLGGIYGYGGTATYGVAFGKYAASENHLTIDSTNGIRFFEGTSTVIAQWNGTVMTLGQTTVEHLRASGTELQFKDGATVYTELKAGALTLGYVAGGEYVKVSSSGIEMYGGGVKHVDLASSGALWLGDTSTTERLAWDATNGLRVFNAAGTAIVKFPISGDAQIIGTLAVTSPGKITAGGGAVVLDVDGITLDCGTAVANQLTWKDSAGKARLVIGGKGAAGTGDAELLMRILQQDGLSPAGEVSLDEIAGKFEVKYVNLLLATAQKKIQFVDSNTEIWEDASSNLSLKDAVAGTFLLEEMGWTMLTTPKTSASWNGDSYSDVATSTQLDLSTVFGVPAGVKAVLLQMSCKDSAAWGTDGLYFGCGPSSTYWHAGLCRPAGGDVEEEAFAVVPCDANGDVWYQINASGASTMDITLRIWGYLGR